MRHLFEVAFDRLSMAEVNEAVDEILEGAERVRVSDRPHDEALKRLVPTFPPDEPLFLLRGQDRFTPETVWAYIEAITSMLVEGEALGEHGRAAYRAWQALCQWQQSHPDRVKSPD